MEDNLVTKQELHMESTGTYTDGSMGMRGPFDVPLYLRVYRLWKKGKDHKPKKKIYSKDLRGWTLEVDAFTFGVKVFVKVSRDGTLAVFAEDQDGMTKLEEWKK